MHIRLSMNEEVTTHPSLLYAAVIRKKSSDRPRMHQEEVCFGKWRRRVTPPMEKACYTRAFCKSFPCLRNIARTLLSLQLKISGHSNRRDNLGTTRWKKIFWREECQGTNTKNHNLEKSLHFFPQTENLIRTWLPFRIFRGYLWCCWDFNLLNTQVSLF